MEKKIYKEEIVVTQADNVTLLVEYVLLVFDKFVTKIIRYDKKADKENLPL